MFPIQLFLQLRIFVCDRYSSKVQNTQINILCLADGTKLWLALENGEIVHYKFALCM